MSEPVSLQPSLHAPSPAGEPGVPCERCGTFVQGKPRNVGVRQVCETCASLLREELRLYPSWYVSALGILINFTLAGVLSAINWRRLGDRSRMRNALVSAMAGVVWTAIYVLMTYRSDPRLSAGLIITRGLINGVFNLVGTLVATQALKPEYEQHVREGGARANLLWPLLIGPATLLALGTGAEWIFFYTQQPPE